MAMKVLVKLLLLAVSCALVCGKPQFGFPIGGNYLSNCGAESGTDVKFV